MEMRHRLPRVVAMIDDEAVSRTRDAEFLPETCRDDEEMAKQLLMGRVGVRDARNRFDGDDEQMHQRLRLNIPEGNAIFITIDGG